MRQETNVKALNSAFKIEISNIPSDKSISHRVAIFSILSNDTSIVENYLEAEDTIRSLDIIRALGARVIREANRLIIIPSSKKPNMDNLKFYCGNSGTTMRIVTGLLIGLNGNFELGGDEFLMKRPMDRVVQPLQDIGCNIKALKDDKYPPISIGHSPINSFDFKAKIASAQVKSALILAGLQANGTSYYEESIKTRDHSENMLIDMGANIQSETTKDGNNKITIKPMKEALEPLNIKVPSDPSSAFFFAVLTCIIPNSSIVLKNISLNETRIEAFKILEKMGANISFIKTSSAKESVGNIEVSSSNLVGVVVENNIAWLIDEIPALAIAFLFAKGSSVVKNATELRVKECDRITAVVENLQKCGANIKEYDDGFEVIPVSLNTSNVHSVKSYGDHRIAMSFAILGLSININIDDVSCINTSFPNFFDIIKDIRNHTL